MSGAVYALLFGFVRSVLKSASQAIWEGLWGVLFAAIEEAEERWREEGKGQERKSFVEDKVMSFVQEKADLNFIQRQAVKLFVSKTIDTIVEQLDDELGENWIEKVDEYKQELADMISFIN